MPFFVRQEETIFLYLSIDVSFLLEFIISMKWR